MTPETLMLATGVSASMARLWAPVLTEAMSRFGIDTSRRQAQFLAQTAHESGGFSRLEENLNYDAPGLARTWPSRFSSDGAPNYTPNELARKIARQPERIANAAYGGRMGNNATTDGWTYRGRGLIQLTGKANYQAAATALNAPLVEQPDRVADRDMAALTAAWFWSKNGLNKPAGLGDTKAVTRKINGGLTGLADRLQRYERAAKALGV